MSAAYREHGYSMREIASAVGLHYSPISKIIQTWEENLTFKTPHAHETTPLKGGKKPNRHQFKAPGKNRLHSEGVMQLAQFY